MKCPNCGEDGVDADPETVEEDELLTCDECSEICRAEIVRRVRLRSVAPEESEDDDAPRPAA
jgi:hypothetical protein